MPGLTGESYVRRRLQESMASGFLAAERLSRAFEDDPLHALELAARLEGSITDMVPASVVATRLADGDPLTKIRTVVFNRLVRSGGEGPLLDPLRCSWIAWLEHIELALEVDRHDGPVPA